MTFKKLTPLAMAAVFMAGSVSFASAQTATDGAIGGTVQDNTGASLPNATVTIRNKGTNATQNLTSDGSGFFRAIHLQPGEYTLHVEAAGFKGYDAQTVIVTVGSLTPVTPTLSIGGSTEVVEVTSVSPLVNSTNNDFTGTINQTTLQDLPVSNYRWSAYAALTPGVVVDASGFGLLSFRGQSTLLNNVTIDGADDNQAYFSEERGRTRAGYSTAKASIQEFQVNTSNYSTEYGRSAGGVVNSITKSGTNAFHGELYFNDRDAEWGGFNDYAFQTVQTAPGVFTSQHIKPTDKRKQYGGAIGGPIFKDKVFFFFAGDRFDHNFPSVAVPSNPGNFFAIPDAALPAGKVCGTTVAATAPSAIDAISCSLQTNLGLTTYAAAAADYTNGIAGLTTELGVVPRKGLQDIFFPKVDWQINGRNRASFEVNRLRWVSPAGIQTGLTTNNGVASYGNDYVRDTFGIARLDTQISNTISNEIRYQYGRDFEFEFGQTPTAYEQTNIVNGTSIGGLPPSVSITNAFTFGTPNFLERAALPDERRWQIADTANLVRGNHNIKFGIDFIHTNDLVSNLFSGFGVYSYSSLLNYITDFYDRTEPTAAAASNKTTNIFGKHYSSFTQGFGVPGIEFQTRDYAAFVEDNWKVTRRLSVTAGVRYEYESLPNPQANLVNADIPATGNRPAYKGDIGPRVGFAYDVFGTGKTIVRGGYGEFFARILNGTIENALLNTGVGAGQFTVANTPTGATAPIFPNVNAGGALAGTPNVVYFDSNFKAPEIHQADLTVEQDLGHNTVMSVTWLGSYGRRLQDFVDTNLPTTPTTVQYTVNDTSGKGPLAPGSVITSKFYNKSTLSTTVCPSQRISSYSQAVSCKYGSITDIFSGVNSNYEGLVFQLSHRLSNHFQFNGNYTFSHALDYGENNTTQTSVSALFDPQNLRADYGNSTQNVPNRLVLNAVAYSPYKAHNQYLGYLVNDFEMSPSYALQSGLPYSVGTSGTLSNAFGVSTGAIGGGINGSNGAFRLPGFERNGLSQPKTNVLDLRISKRFVVKERFKVELYGESFNIINHQNVTGVNSTGYFIGNANGTSGGVSRPIQNTLTFNTNSANATQPLFGTVTSTNSSNFQFSPRQIQIAARIQF